MVKRKTPVDRTGRGRNGLDDTAIRGIEYGSQMDDVRFSYDPRKSAANLEKHGIDFEEAILVLLGDTVSFASPTQGEPRCLTIGRLEGDGMWSVVCLKEGGECRIISARPATQKERSCYDRYFNQR